MWRYAVRVNGRRFFLALAIYWLLTVDRMIAGIVLYDPDASVGGKYLQAIYLASIPLHGLGAQDFTAGLTLDSSN